MAMTQRDDALRHAFRASDQLDRKAISDLSFYAAQLAEHVRTAFVLLDALSDIEPGTVEDIENIRHRLNEAGKVFAKLRDAA